MMDRKLEEKAACSVKSAPAPSEVVCAHCNEEVEIWSDEPEAVCSTCSRVVKK